MTPPPVHRFVVPLLGCLVASCAVTEPETEAQAPPPKIEKKTEEIVVEAPPPVTPPPDGLRLPSGLDQLPEESEFRPATSPSSKPSSGGGALVVRPPADLAPTLPKDPEPPAN